MRHWQAIFIVPFMVGACGTATQSAALGTPAHPPELLLPAAVPDLPRAACVAHVLAAEAAQHANRLRRRESSTWLSAANAQTREEAAARAYSNAVFRATRAANSASQQPRNEGAQAAARSARVNATLSLSAWVANQRFFETANRASLAVSDSSAVAFRFASVSEQHATLFEIEADQEIESTRDRQEEHAEALAELQRAVTLRPELEFLYVERFIRAYEKPPSACEK